MKIATLTATISRNAGGLFNSVRRLSQTLAGFPDTQVGILSLADGHSDEDLERWLPLVPEVLPPRGPSALRYSPLLRPRLEALDPDLVRVDGLWTWNSAVAGAWSRRHRRPGVIAPRGMLDAWALQNSPWKKHLAGLWFEQSHLRGAACLHALCEAELQAFRQFGLPNAVCVVPNGVDLPAASAASGGSSGAGESNVLLYLGRLHPKKGLVNLLAAWARVPASLRNAWVLRIAGWDQGGHEAALQQQAAQLGITSAARPGAMPGMVEFLGPRFGAEKDAAYAGADAFILPSFSEGLPMVVLEAWAHAKPVLMTPECNLPEGFAAGAALRINTSPEDIAEGLRRLFERTDADRRDMGQRGRVLVEERFTWPKVATQMREVYVWLRGGGPPPGCVVVS